MDAPVPNNSAPEVWQINVAGQIYEANFEELTQWIAEGSLLPQDKVRRGNLRWIEANKVPGLRGFFNAKELGIAPPTVSTTTAQSPTQNQPNNLTIQTFGNHQTISNFSDTRSTKSVVEIANTSFCLVHIETEPKHICNACRNVFCEDCPQSYGGSVKICPMCGGMCNPIKDAVEKEQKTVALHQAENEGFGFLDFGRAITYPFKFRVSLFFGSLLYVFFAIGQHASSLGGRWLIAASMICGMLTNMLTFGILANIVENMLQGKINQNFMPNYDDFSLWDDAIHPLFLSISTYLASFGPFLILCIVMIFFAVNSFNSKTDSLQPNNVAPTLIVPELQNEYGSAKNANEQIELFKETLKKREEYLKQKMQSAEEHREAPGDFENNELQTAPPPVNFDEEKESQKLSEMMNKTRQQQLQSTIGAPEEKADDMGFGNVYSQIFAWALPFILLAGLTILWGIFYYPVALIVASYTRNLGSVLNPLVGLDTIKRLGFDYVKILFFGFLLLIVGGFISLFLNIVFAAFTLPRLGNIPAVAVGSIFTFYLSIVFSVLIGFALYKNLSKFQLYRNN